MSNIINAVSGGSGGVSVTGDTSGQLVLQTAGTTAVTVNSSQQTTFANTINTPNTFGFKNRIINGAMVIDQRNAGAASANTINGYFLDRWQVNVSVTGKLIAQQNAGSVTGPTGLPYYLGVTSQSAYSVVANDFYLISQYIEGLNTADLAWGTTSAAAVTVSFWVRSSLTGTFGVSICNYNSTYNYIATYIVNNANTWEQKTITIAGSTSGGWQINNSIGLQLRFCLGAGSTYQGSAGAWSGNNLLTTSAQTSVVGTNGATFYITGVQLEAGSTATSFDYRPYGTELNLCQRYCFVQGYAQGSGAYGSIGVGINQTTTAVSFDYFLPVPMRTTPSLTWTTATYNDINSGASGTVISLNFPRSGPTQLFLQGTYTSGTATAGSVAFLNMVNITTWQAIFSADL
jgi:hypothetical protein